MPDQDDFDGLRNVKAILAHGRMVTIRSRLYASEEQGTVSGVLDGGCTG